MQMVAVFSLCETPTLEQTRLLTLLSDSYRRLTLLAEELLGCLARTTDHQIVEVFATFNRLQTELVSRMRFQPLSLQFCLDCAMRKRPLDDAADWIASHHVAIRYMALLRSRLFALHSRLMFSFMPDSMAQISVSFKGLSSDEAMAYCRDQALATGHLASEIDNHFEQNLAQQLSPR
jgi:hypothetical protein